MKDDPLDNPQRSGYFKDNRISLKMTAAMRYDRRGSTAHSAPCVR